MKKSNKILMATVAILLSLVLISTSIVSGIFARFVIEKSGSTAIKFNKFGVELELEIDDDVYAAVGGAESNNVTLKQDGNSLSVEIRNLKMAPGESYLDAISFNISGTPNVRAKVVIEPKVEFEKDDFAKLNDKDTFWGVPVGLYYSAYDENFEKVIKPFVPTWDGGSNSMFQLACGCDWGLGTDYDLTACTNDPAGWNAKYGWTEKIFEKNQNVVFYSSNDSNKTHAINQFDFHLMWEEKQKNELDTAIGSANPKPALSIILNVKIEQVDSNYVSPVPVESED